MKLTGRLIVSACALIAVGAGVVLGTTNRQDTPLQADIAAGEGPGYAVEDFNYPRADKIREERGIVLKRGDGHIVLAECGSEEGLLEVSARNMDMVCFRVTGDSGYLAMEIPSVYGVKGNTYETEVTMTVGEQEKQYKIKKNTWTQVGEAADPRDGEHMLVEIVTHK